MQVAKYLDMEFEIVYSNEGLWNPETQNGACFGVSAVMLHLYFQIPHRSHKTRKLPKLGAVLSE